MTVDETFVPLSAKYWCNPKVMRASNAAIGLHAKAMSLAKHLGTDGVIDRLQVERLLGASDAEIEELAAAGLVTLEGDVVQLEGWLERNPSALALASVRQARRVAGRKGNHAKYGHPGDVEDCPVCNPPEQTPMSLAVAIPPESQTLANGSGCEHLPSLTVTRTVSGTGAAPDQRAEAAASAQVDIDRRRANGETIGPGLERIIHDEHRQAADERTVARIHAEQSSEAVTVHNAELRAITNDTPVPDWRTTLQTARKGLEHPMPE